MRIAYIISTPEGIGGAEKVLLDVVLRGNQEGHIQLVLNPYERPADASSLAMEATKVAEYGAANFTGSGFVRARRWADGRLRDFSPDLLVSFLPLAMATAAPFCRKRLIPLVASHQHGDHLVATGQKLKRVVDKWAGGRHNAVVACSEAVRQFLIADYGYSPSHVITIRNGWSGDPLPREGAARPTVVCVANFRPQKNHAVLLRALGEVRSEIPDVQLLLLGEGPLRQDLVRLGDSLGLSDCVNFVGRAANIWPYLATADVGVLPSSYEPLGIAVLEYMAAGLPVVASRVGGVPEIVREGKSGYLVTPKDAHELSERLITLLKDRNLRRSMSREGVNAAQSFTADNMCDGYFRLFSSLHHEASTK